MKTYTLNQQSNIQEPLPVDPKNFKIDYRSELNDAQYQAATSIEGAHLVIAGAGSGKTRTLIYRMAYLVESGISPRSILLLTFTRKASDEMMNRAAKILDPRCKDVQGGTFHSFANLTLRRYGKAVGFDSNFTIMDRSDAEDTINLIRNEMGLNKKERRFPKKSTLMNLFSKMTNTGKAIEDLIREDYPNFLNDTADIERVAVRYSEYKKTNALMDYDDLLVYLRDLLFYNKDIRRKLSLFNRYIMIDEYQDTNHLQLEIVKLLASEHQNVMVVGDDSQSIYSFRGANFKNIMDFPKKDFPNCNITTLEQNYRSTQPILDLTNQILESAPEKFEKNLFSEIQGEQKPVFIKPRDDSKQARFTCQRILELREEGVTLNDIAVLFRSSYHSNALEIELGNHNIPFVKYGGIKLVEAAHVKDLTAMLKVIYNPTDAVSWLRLLLLLEGVGTKTAGGIVDEIVNQRLGVEALMNKKYSKRKYAEELGKLHQILKSVSESEASPAEKIESLLKGYKPLLEKKYDNHLNRIRDLESLVRIAANYQDVEAFLSDLSLEPPNQTQSDVEPEDEEDEKLTLSTIHSSKGLEWNSVFLIHLVDGFLPSARSIEDEDEVDEERRLFYVAATRAKENLYLLAPERGPQGGSFYQPSGFGFSMPSRFLTEMENFKDMTEEWRLKE